MSCSVQGHEMEIYERIDPGAFFFFDVFYHQVLVLSDVFVTFFPLQGGSPSKQRGLLRISLFGSVDGECEMGLHDTCNAFFLIMFIYET